MDVRGLTSKHLGLTFKDSDVSPNMREEWGAAEGRAFVFFTFLSIFVYFVNDPSHWDGNPGIGIVNPNNPSQGRSLPPVPQYSALPYTPGYGELVPTSHTPE